MIQTIIFDIGNVLTGVQCRTFYESYGYDAETVEKLETATIFNRDWSELDRGVMAYEDVIEEFVKNDPSIEKEIRESLANLKGLITRCDYAIPWIKELKEKGYQVLFLSNFFDKAYVDCAEALDFLPFTDGGILSYREKVIKPDPEIYKKLIEQYRLIPEECVFLDDLKQNLEGAAAFGIHTILFQNQAQAKEELRRLGVES